MASQKKTCTAGTPGGKHAWTFQKNSSKVTSTSGPAGSFAHAKLVGVYRCDCGATRTGTPNHNAPGNDLRGLLGMPGGAEPSSP